MLRRASGEVLPQRVDADMKFSENWLRQHVKTDATRDELAATLTAIGLEVEEMTVLGEAWTAWSSRDIVECAKHPEADRCRSARSMPATARVQIVCGAPNARPGLKAPLATIGTHAAGGIDDQGRQAARRRFERHAVLGEGTGHRCRRLGPAGAAGRCAGRLAARRLPRPAGRQHRTQADPQPRRLLRRARHRLRRGRRARRAGRTAGRSAGAGASRRDAGGRAACRRRLPALLSAASSTAWTPAARRRCG